METVQQIAARSALFKGIPAKEIPVFFRKLDPSLKRYDKNQQIITESSSIKAIGLVISGKVFVKQEDVWGNLAILAQIGQGDLFAEAYACAGITKSPVNVVASEKSEVLFFDFHHLLTCCSSQPLHTKLIGNMLNIIARKNVYLVEKMYFLTRRTIREKVFAYLSSEAKKHKQNTFNIPFNRQELADFLAVDRSALSKELATMQKEGLLSFNKNQFCLKLL
ncbi:Crp/Fnr family transcriptional regulator [Listeria sp. PSOL-1]|uniref:Crp/Fnr family transcriptional regulator n=1 Tax=Listeria sp. PSOL-1 TaxID=1844999 RepID=UPI0013D22AF2|nr:Crp/Fnr family transcriptional regulator [Listeria sp. PSOL-1]